MRALHENGVAVPGEVSVVGFGGYELGAVTYPPLTTVAFDYEALGRRAAKMPRSMSWAGKSLTDSTASPSSIFSSIFAARRPSAS